VRLCAAWSVEWAYTDGTGEPREAPVETVLAALAALGAPVQVPEDAAIALRAVESPVADPDPAVVAFPSFGTLAGGWGVFAPLFSLHGKRSNRGGGADLTSLGDLGGWVGQQGGRVVTTLPLLAGFESAPAEHSPYRPHSRCFFHGRWLDLERISGFATCQAARSALAEGPVAQALADCAGAELDDVEAVCATRRPVLEALAEDLWRRRPKRLDVFLACHPEVLEYAVFRGTQARHGRDWRRWPEGAEPDPGEVRLRVAEQLWLDEQLAALAGAPVVLGLDLPVGVHPDGYDAWRDREVLADGMELGAPPDAHFPSGQCWELPALVPAAEKARGYLSTRRALAAHCGYAGLLRIDHALGLHRKFWVPKGASAAEGVYVVWPAHELYTLLALEAARTKTVLYFEDLGCEPGDLVMQMEQTRALGMTILQGTSGLSGGGSPGDPTRVASLNTHDMPTWAAFCRDGAVREADEALEEALVGLGASQAGLVLVSLGDLRGEMEPTNVPGTSGGANWRRRGTGSLQQLFQDQRAARLLAQLHTARTGRTE
jgi:4-alpha-glucanotransferase